MVNVDSLTLSQIPNIDGVNYNTALDVKIITSLDAATTDAFV